MNDFPFRVYAVKTKHELRMKRIMMTLLIGFMMMTGANAGQTEQIVRGAALYMADSLKLDSMYNYWNRYTLEHPKDEVAWRNLYEVYDVYEYRFLVNHKNYKTGKEISDAQEQMRRKVGFMYRMEQAIPDSYTFNYCAYDCGYEWLKYENPDDVPDTLSTHYANRAIELIPDKAARFDYDEWAGYLMGNLDTVRLTRLLTQYYENGLYPADELQYHYNELQGMDEGAVYLGQHNGNVIGKLILQLVKGVHRDKILYNEACVVNYSPFLNGCIQRMGLSPQTADSLRRNAQGFKGLERLLRYIFDYVKRPVYLSSNSISMLLFGEGVPDDLKQYLYNEGLTIRYSAKPYDNLRVKRRNVEERYLLDYLRFSFSPDSDRRNSYLSFHYLILLKDLLPYYKANDPDRFRWLNRLYHDVLAQMEDEGEGFLLGNKAFNIHKVENEQGVHYEVEEGTVRYNESFTGLSGKVSKKDGLKYLTGEPIPTHVILKTEPVKD